MNRVKLLSPAGSFESLQAAIQGGADSIYFGIEQLNMRSRSSNNFSIDDLKKIVEICAEKKIKTYLTLNTIIYDHDVSLMKRIINAAKENNVDAIIACDQAVLGYSKKIGMPVHISTQANASNIETVEFFSAYADTIVMARELSLRQVGDIVKQIKRESIKGPSGELIKIEVFAHGALCMAVSGKCYLSLHTHNASANRGACVQNCRRSYIVKDKEEEYIEFEIDNEYIMSSKDLCTIDFMDKIIESGVNILKIEGRGRSADYVYTATKCYREAINSYYEKTYTKDKIIKWKKDLATVFNRGFWDGYYLGKKMGEWTDEYGSKATVKKIYIGKGLKYFSKQNVAEFKLESNQLAVGNNIMITGPTTGIIQDKITELRMEDVPVNSVNKGDIFSFPLNKKIRPSDKLYKVIDAE
jgi:putative protease